jgi:hypothetical protein
VVVSINTRPIGNRLAGSVDCEHGTSMDLIMPAPATHPLTQVGLDIVPSMYKKMTVNSP